MVACFFYLELILRPNLPVRTEFLFKASASIKQFIELSDWTSSQFYLNWSSEREDSSS